LIFETGLAEKWQRRAEASPRMVRVFEDLHRLLEQMQDFETIAISPYLEAYLAAFPKPPALEVSEPAGDLSGVQLLTVHAAKGLEFEGVYLINCTQRSWSAGRSLGRQIPENLWKQKADLPPEHEFRRLMYVAVTRGKKWLRISAPVASVGGMKQITSPFVGEIFGPEKLLQPLKSPQQSGAKDLLLTKLQRFYPLNVLENSSKLPFEDNEGWLDLSVTALGQYEFCPFEFYLQHVLKISQPMGPQLGFGNALHGTFEQYYKSKLANLGLSLSELHHVLDELWTDKGYGERSAAEADRELAHQTLSNFFEREESIKRVTIGSEVPIRFDVPQARLRIRGKIDALFQRTDGVEVRDFKTGRNKTSADKLAKQAKANFQLRSYALALKELKGEPPAAVVLDYVVTGVEGEAELTKTILNNHLDKLQVMADSIRNRDFAPNPSAMHDCAAIKYYGTGEQEELLAGISEGEGM
jgi:RecB family exonuclease